MLTTTNPHSARARRTRVRWPSCSAPIVGTSPICLPLLFARLTAARISSIVWTTSIYLPAGKRWALTSSL